MVKVETVAKLMNIDISKIPIDVREQIEVKTSTKDACIYLKTIFNTSNNNSSTSATLELQSALVIGIKEKDDIVFVVNDSKLYAVGCKYTKNKPDMQIGDILNIKGSLSKNGKYIYGNEINVHGNISINDIDIDDLITLPESTGVYITMLQPIRIAEDTNFKGEKVMKALFRCGDKWVSYDNPDFDIDPDNILIAIGVFTLNKTGKTLYANNLLPIEY